MNDNKVLKNVTENETTISNRLVWIPALLTALLIATLSLIPGNTFYQAIFSAHPEPALQAAFYIGIVTAFAFKAAFLGHFILKPIWYVWRPQDRPITNDELNSILPKARAKLFQDLGLQAGDSLPPLESIEYQQDKGTNRTPMVGWLTPAGQDVASNNQKYNQALYLLELNKNSVDRADNLPVTHTVPPITFPNRPNINGKS